MKKPVPVTALRGVDRWLWWGLVIIIVGLPFHAVFITWIGTHTSGRLVDGLRLWYEAITVALVIGSSWLIWRHSNLRRAWLRDRLNLLILAFTAVHLLVWLIIGAHTGNAILALKVNLEFLAVFTTARVLAARNPDLNLGARILKYILAPAAVVAAFGLVQSAAGQHDILRWFGYAADRPNQFVSGNTLRRLTSTLWGPNQFGSYLVLPLVLSLWLGLYRRRYLAYILAAALGVVLYGSQSRGAWVAAAISTATLIWLYRRQWGYRLFLVAALAAAVAGFAILSLYRPLVIWHNSDSNTGHLTALSAGFEHLQAHPLGAGLEAAGKASESTDAKLYTENFYLQVAVQTGWEGLVLFVAICAYVGGRLWRLMAKSALALSLAAVFLGLAVNNLVAHTWSDAATAMLWWGMAGLVIGKSDDWR